MTCYIKLKYCINCLKPYDGTNSHFPILATNDSKCDKFAKKCDKTHDKTCPDLTKYHWIIFTIKKHLLFGKKLGKIWEFIICSE